jgi:hypothetical protein
MFVMMMMMMMMMMMVVVMCNRPELYNTPHQRRKLLINFCIVFDMTDFKSHNDIRNTSKVNTKVT